MRNEVTPQIKQLYKKENNIIRVLDTSTDMICVIDCTKYTMPIWKPIEILSGYTTCSEEELLTADSIALLDINDLDSECKKVIHQRYTLIAPILLYVSDKKRRTEILLLSIFGLSKYDSSRAKNFHP